MSDMFYVGQPDYIAKLNELATRVGTQGPQGDPGGRILSGVGSPVGQSPDIGNDGDYYLDTSTSILYLKSGGVWAETTTIPGTGALSVGELDSTADASPAGTLTLDWAAHQVYVISLNSVLDTLIFTGSSTITPFQPITLCIRQAGGGSLDPALWDNTINSGYLFNMTVPSHINLPTYLDTGVGRQLIVAFSVGGELNQVIVPIAFTIGSPAHTNNAIIDGQTPSTGFSYTIYDGCELLALNPAGTLATGTVTMPPNPYHTQVVIISSTKIITALTLTPNSGQSFGFTPTTIPAGGVLRFMWDAVQAKWWPA